MLYWLIPLIVGLLLLVFFLYFRVKENRKVAVILKGLTSLMFILTGIVALFCSKSNSFTYGALIIIGLFFGLLGDVFLDLKFMSSKYEYLFTALGFVTFGIGHIFYSTGLLVYFFDFSRNIFYFIIPIIISIVLTIFSLLMEKFTPIRYGKMVPFVIGYGLIIFFTVMIHLSSCFQYSWNLTHLIIMFISLVMFALSDLILNNTYFSKGCNTPIYIISNHIIYYLGQFGLAVSLFFLI